MNVSRIGQKQPRLWCVCSRLTVMPAFSGIFPCEIDEKSHLNRTEVEMASQL